MQIENRAKDLYTELLLKSVDKKLKSWTVALDTANGAQTVVMPELLTTLGLKVYQVNCDLEKPFIARDTDTDDQAKIEDLKSLVVSKKCDFGIAFDGDGDRVVFVDEKGNFIHGEYSCSLIAKDMPGENLVTTISASQVVDTIGKKVYRTKVGSPYVIEKIKEVKASFGFEPNGGAIFPDIMFTRDGGSMMIKMLNRLNHFDGTFSELVDTLPKFYMERTKVEYKWELKDKILAEAKKEFKGVKIEELDGLKIWLNDKTWILFRSSMNAPEFRVFAESNNEQTAKDLLKKGMELVTKWI